MAEAPRASHQTTPIPIRVARGLRPAPVPRPLTSFFGRDRERAEIAALLTQDETRLVTLVGPAGVGKTRLALHVAADLQPAFAVVGFASLAPVTDPAQIVPAAGDALGLREPTIERIGEQLGGMPALLVLDNLEQITGAAGVLGTLLISCPSLRILATSRTVLRVSGEHIYPVLPFTTEPGSAEQLTESPALQLFSARATAADPSFRLDETNTQAVAQICRQVDGLPLAIELAAGQVRLLTPQAILSRLDRRLDVLTHGPEDQPERQQSLEHAIRWSYDLLSPDEQRAFRRLGVCSGGFSEDAARQIALDDAGPALPLLATLLDASLLIRSVQPDGESRYALLETIREFCLLELRASGEEPAIRQAHAAYYLQLAARAEPRLIVIGSAEWVRRLAVEHANLHDAVEWSLEAGEPEPVLGLAGTLLSMAYARGEPAESLSWLERAIAMAESSPAPLVSDALFAASALAQVQGHFDRSVELATRSLEVARAAGYAFGEGRALLGLGISAEWAHDLELAETRYRDARSIMQTLDPTDRLAHWRVLPIANLADVALFRGQHREAIELGSEAVAAWREAGYLWGTAQALGTVAAARCELGDLEGARRDYRETLELWIACADGRGIAGTIAGIAAVAARSGDAGAAALLLGGAWNLRATLGLEYMTHHLYAEQVRAALYSRSGAEAQLAGADAKGRALSLDEAVAAARQVLEANGRRLQQPAPTTLSAREREVLACIVEGMHDREIADRLCISPRTVQSHVLAILNKLGAHSRAEAVAIALRNDLL
jgi:predicted ATPase/DNA-binding CsgD family transcriptional regulator